VAAPLEKYKVPARPYRYGFYFTPYEKGGKAPGDKAREVKARTF
jgi:hypothetical protein